MQLLKELPEFVASMAQRVPNPFSKSTTAAARHFRKGFSLPYNKWNSARYLSTIGRRLNGKVQFLKGLGRHATWYIPAAFALYNVSQAPEEMQMKTLFEEGFGVLGGYAGTLIGGQVLAAGAIGAFALFGLCLGPFGIFLTVFICASAGGIAGSMAGKEFGSETYDLGSRLNGRIFSSADELIGVF